jgi:hypothetical protein
MDIPVSILMRASLAEYEEFEAVKKIYPTSDQRTLVLSDSLVIPRYSALPFYKELEIDLAIRNCLMINTYEQHLFAADIKRWYPELFDITPNTYFDLMNIPEIGPFVVKGATNSRKHLWNTHMFAKDRDEVLGVYSRLMDDSMISEQDICVRDYIPLNTFCVGINGLPITEEYRFFFLGDKPIAGGFYWQNYVDDIDPALIDKDKVPWTLLEKIGFIVSRHMNFYVADIAKTESGEWILIEINDGQMAGLSCIEPEKLYKGLKLHMDQYRSLDKNRLLSYTPRD